MRLVLGLGNPGVKYESTRHNSGFDTIGQVTAFLQLKLRKRCFRPYRYALAEGKQEQFLLVTPLTYMNDSGDVLSYFPQIEAKDLIVVCDQMDLPVGMIRIKTGGGDAGHNGLKSIIAALHGNRGFVRLYVGIGRPGNGTSVVDHVLGKEPDERSRKQGIGRAAEALEDIIGGMDLQEVMRKYNRTNSIG
ncbi:MAG: aminoacyl-tRNA hydrolase [Spirochaetia bacterium]|jgi:PTH1 family peptidyl-tRNA hydrolase|nr:aminoacyl-tRNA hydrolase [Spirochaetia bacterium]